MPGPAARLRPGDPGKQRPAFRPDRVYLGWQHAVLVPDPGPRPSAPTGPGLDGAGLDGAGLDGAGLDGADPAGLDPAGSYRGSGDWGMAAWLAAQRREEDQLARPHRVVVACSAVVVAAAAAGWLTGVLTGGVLALGGGASLTVGAVSLRALWRGARSLRERVAQERDRVAAFRAVAEQQRTAGDAEHARQLQAWRRRGAAFARQPQWYPVTLPGGVHRVDVAGGTLAGWSALLTSVAVPRLAAGGEVTVLDLTEGAVAGDLLSLARDCGIDPLVWVLPADLPRLDLGAELSGDALAEVLAVTVGGADFDPAGHGGAGAGADEAGDAALLRRVLSVLGADARIGQLTAALRALAQVGDPRADVRAGLLTVGQVDGLTGLFGRAAIERVVLDRAWAIEARLGVLASLGTALAGLPHSRLRLASLDRLAGGVGGRVLGSYLVAALTQLLRQVPPGRPWQQTLVVLGAEKQRPELLDRLTDACEISRTGLVLAYRSVPAHVRERLGRGHAAVAYMRLGNADDARAAAEQLGTEHRFVVSQLTQTIGTSVTATTGDSYTSTVGTADSVTDSASVTDTAGRSTGRGSSAVAAFAPFGQVTGSTSRDRSTSRALSDSVSLTAGINASTAWGWSTSQALGVNDSLAQSTQRSREFLVEQYELQQLPASAVLLTYAGPAGRRVVLADVNPAIIGLRTTTLVGLDEVSARMTGTGGAPPPSARA